MLEGLYSQFTGWSKINGAKFSDACSVRANWLCRGWPFCLAEMRQEFQTGGNFLPAARNKHAGLHVRWAKSEEGEEEETFALKRLKEIARG